MPGAGSWYCRSGTCKEGIKMKADTYEGSLIIASQEIETLKQENEKLQERIGQLEAARTAYASEFDGDVGSIHQSIRNLKQACDMFEENSKHCSDEFEARLAAEQEAKTLREELKEAAELINLSGYKEWKRGNDFHTRCVNFLTRNGYKYGYVE